MNLSHKLPISLCFFTTTKGHYGLGNRYEETLSSFNNQIALSNFSYLHANIRITSKHENSSLLTEMKSKISDYGFFLSLVEGDYKHASEQKMVGYLNDMVNSYNLYEVAKNPFIMHLEDDWLLHPYDGALINYILNAMKVLNNNHDILQVRFPRFSNEKERILNVNEKFKVERSIEDVNDFFFVSDEFGLQPSIFRTRDLLNSINQMVYRQKELPLHIEMGLMNVLSTFSLKKNCFAAYNPSKIRALHIGEPQGKEDKSDIPLLA